MKLTIKELAPYLPYGLKIRMFLYNFGDCEITMGLKNIEPDKIFNKDLEQLPPTEPLKEVGISVVLSDSFIKPILRPLSDLTTNAFIFKKDLEHIKLHNEVITMRYYVVEYLFQNHYDVFGLIEQNLAIDINTLKE